MRFFKISIRYLTDKNHPCKSSQNKDINVLPNIYHSFGSASGRTSVSYLIVCIDFLIIFSHIDRQNKTITAYKKYAYLTFVLLPDCHVSFSWSLPVRLWSFPFGKVNPSSIPIRNQGSIQTYVLCPFVYIFPLKMCVRPRNVPRKIVSRDCISIDSE